MDAPSPARDGPPQGSCAGYEIRSRLAFRTLRFGGGTPLYVEEIADLAPSGDVQLSWQPRPGNPFQGLLLKDGHRFAFWASDAGWYVIDPFVPAITVPVSADPLRRELRMFGVPVSICTHEAGGVSIHASAVEVSGQGVLLAGPSRYGKTTLAAAFARAGHRLLSEDSTRCTTTGQPTIHPGPAALRLRPDVASWLTVTGSPAATEPDGRVPLIVDPPQRGDGRAIPLGLVVLLRAGSGPTVLERRPAAAALRDLLALTFQLPDAAAREACFTRIADLAAQVPVVDLHRRLEADTVDDVVSLIVRRLGGG